MTGGSYKMYGSILGRVFMADTSGNWLANVLDAASFSCILVAIEEFGRTVARAGPTMSPLAQLCFLSGGIALSFLGKKGAKTWQGLWDWLTRKSLKDEIAKLKAERHTESFPRDSSKISSPRTVETKDPLCALREWPAN
jgi:hypothetical protein